MVYILFGEDEERSRYKLGTIKKNTTFDVLETFDLETDAAAQVLDAIDTVSLFDEKSLVVIDHATFLGKEARAKTPKTKAAPGKKKGRTAKKDKVLTPAQQMMEDFGKRDPEDKTIVFMVPAKTLDKDVKKHFPHATYIESKGLDEKTLPGIVRDLLIEKKMQMDPDALDWFVRNVGLNMMRIYSELDKLQVYSDHITLQDVRALVAAEPTENVFAMTDALFEKRYLDLIALYRQFRTGGMEPIAVNGLLASQIRFIFQVRTLMDLRFQQSEIADKLHVSSGRIYYSMKKARRFTASRLLGFLDMLAELDYQMKSGLVDKDDGFEDFFLGMMTQEKSGMASTRGWMH